MIIFTAATAATTITIITVIVVIIIGGAHIPGDYILYGGA
jgi:hypothetical protein